ncbi:transglycosylase SLT domain-containing protein [Candidatus Blochmannia ocreatus (nom. nud.)]|uniref:peptidoglycan lytic exotransglycosylase n=1 Tax=Candidatus Blochmannia ocreatus (nom. nud.) TaxID=251538 RepID=A0ABY4SSN8_9ENTR|nr:transglycosylase SLT domain-containing protein [Candidatus Blochmannia ocreatus]URJ24896.1 transglycosylase SLT domain-containing protein [Candidatus Blochmannia ocreatus]
MKIQVLYLIIILFLTSCAWKNVEKYTMYNKFPVHLKYEILNYPNKDNCDLYHDYIHYYAVNYGVEESLVKSIIQVESNYNPTVVSKSKAIGLMQVKADTAGRDAYRLKGWMGKPSINELKNAAINIDIGTAYLSILQKKLNGIIDDNTRRYALIVAYVNGLNALFRIFDADHNNAIAKINQLDSVQFYEYIQSHHPSQQAKRYLAKVNAIYVVHSG